MKTDHSLFNRILKWAFNPKDGGPGSLRILFLVNPILILGFFLVTNGFVENFWRRYLYSLLIGEGVALTCILMAKLVGFVGFRILKIEVPRRTFILSSIAAMFPGLWVGFFLADLVFGITVGEKRNHSFGDYSNGIMIGAFFLGFFSLVDLWLVEVKRTKTLENENLQAKLSALTAQMNPHLLFNALNTIASTISSHPQAAEETTIKLSDLYRGILSSSKNPSHELATELEICRAYLGIESDRFGERLKWSIEIEAGLEKFKIPSLLIQPLVENAVKHGISQKTEGGKIAVSVKRHQNFIEIQVQDDGVGFGNSRAQKGTGTGISSCRSRLELLYQGKASFETLPLIGKTGTKVFIRIPAEEDSS